MDKEFLEEQKEMTPEENYESLTTKLYYRGFGDSLNEVLKEQMLSDKPQFSLEHYASIGDDEMAYRLHFRRDEQTGRVYFNTYDAALLKDSHQPEGGVKEHTFGADRKITAMEAYRMLKYGNLVAVNKDLYNKAGEPYNVWMSIDTSGPKDESGNYPVQSYHQNYYRKQPFDLKGMLRNPPVPVKELQLPAHAENIEKALRKASLPEITMLIDGQEVKGLLRVDPKIGTILMLDQNGKLLEFQEKQALDEQQQVKKKFGQQQGTVSWGKRQKPKGPKFSS